MNRKLARKQRPKTGLGYDGGMHQYELRVTCKTCSEYHIMPNMSINSNKTHMTFKAYNPLTGYANMDSVMMLPCGHKQDMEHARVIPVGRGSVYLCCETEAFDNEVYRKLVSLLKKKWTGVTIIQGTADNAKRVATWHEVLDTATHIVFFGGLDWDNEWDEIIKKEVKEGLANGLSIFFYEPDDGSLINLHSISFA